MAGDDEKPDDPADREEAEELREFLEEVDSIEGYEETESEKWAGAWVAVDPEHPDDQWIISTEHTHPWDEADGELPPGDHEDDREE